MVSLLCFYMMGLGANFNIREVWSSVNSCANSHYDIYQDTFLKKGEDMKKEGWKKKGGGGANKPLHTMICLSSYDSADTYFKLTRFNTIRWSVYDESIVLKWVCCKETKLTDFLQLVSFYIPWKHQYTRGFLGVLK